MITTARPGTTRRSGGKTATPSRPRGDSGQSPGFELFPFGVGNANTTCLWTFCGVDGGERQSQTPTELRVVWGSRLHARCDDRRGAAALVDQPECTRTPWSSSALRDLPEPAYGLGTNTAYSPADDTMGRLIIELPFQRSSSDVILGAATSAARLYAPGVKSPRVVGCCRKTAAMGEGDRVPARSW